VAGLASGSAEQTHGDPGEHRSRIVQIDREIADLWSRAVLSAIRQGDPFAFGKEKLLDARRHVGRAFDQSERIRRRGLFWSDGPRDRTQEQTSLEWTVKDLRDLEFPTRRADEWSPEATARFAKQRMSRSHGGGSRSALSRGTPADGRRRGR
jgi:hypothetical protein